MPRIKELFIQKGRKLIVKDWPIRQFDKLTAGNLRVNLPRQSAAKAGGDEKTAKKAVFYL